MGEIRSIVVSKGPAYLLIWVSRVERASNLAVWRSAVLLHHSLLLLPLLGLSGLCPVPLPSLLIKLLLAFVAEAQVVSGGPASPKLLVAVAQSNLKQSVLVSHYEKSVAKLNFELLARMRANFEFVAFLDPRPACRRMGLRI